MPITNQHARAAILAVIDDQRVVVKRAQATAESAQKAADQAQAARRDAETKLTELCAEVDVPVVPPPPVPAKPGMPVKK